MGRSETPSGTPSGAPRDEESTEPLSEEERQALILEFETTGFATFRIGEDQASFIALTDYIAANHIPTFNDVSEEEGTVIITKRPWGSLELG